MAKKSKKKKGRKTHHIIAKLKPEHVAAIVEVSKDEPIVLAAVPHSAWQDFKRFMGW